MEAVERLQVLRAHLRVKFCARFLSVPGPQGHTALYGGNDLILASVSGTTREIAHLVDCLIRQGQDFKDGPLSITVSDMLECQIPAQLEQTLAGCFYCLL